MAKTINTNLPSVSTGDVLSATAYNNAITSLNSTTVPPMVRLRRVAGQTLTSSGTVYAINWDTSDTNVDGMITVSNTAITVQTAGVYLMCLQGSFAALNTTGIRSAGIYLNPTVSGSGDSTTITAGTRIYNASNSAPTAAAEAVTSCVGIYDLALSAVIRCSAFQSSGSSLATGTTDPFTFSMILLGRSS